MLKSIPKTYKQPKPAKQGLHAFRKLVGACDTDASRTTIMPLVRRAVEEFNFDPDLITPHVPATHYTVGNWFKGKCTPNAASRAAMKTVLIKFLWSQPLGAPAPHFRALRIQLETYDPEDPQGFDNLLQHTNRLFPDVLVPISGEARVPYASLKEWLKGGPSQSFQRRRVIEVILSKYLWRYK